MSDDDNVEVQLCLRGKRKREQKSCWKKTKESVKRNSAEGKTPMVGCSHRSTKLCKANELTQVDIQEFFHKLYMHSSAAQQNNFLIKFITPQKPNRHRPRTAEPKQRLRNDYYIRKIDGSTVRTCASTFKSITQISQFRIKSIAAYFFKEGVPRPERRGGSRLSLKDNETTKSIIDHIKSLKPRSSHYGRNKSIRLYLPPELSVKKLYKMWCNIRKTMDAPTASFSKYYKIFARKFNIGFGNPRTDVCSFCEQRQLEMTNTTNMEIRTRLTTELKEHKLSAKKIYELLKKEEPNYVVKVAFDMQQNQPLPKLNISEVYYMRQLWLYNLTFVIIEPNQNRENTFSYTWTENESGKGSNEVCSALKHFLGLLEARYDDVNPANRPSTLKLFSDSCPGQNKNSAVIFMLLCHVQNSMFTEIVHIFPIRGHSFLPPDRVFGRSEKIIKRQEQIASPESYYDIFRHNSTVLQNGKDWNINDYKTAISTFFKRKLPFKITEQRVFTYCKGKKTVHVKSTYTGSLSSHSVLKSNNTNLINALKNVKPSSPINKISIQKKSNVQHLLKYIKLTDAEKTFYHNALKNVEPRDTDNLRVVDDGNN